MRVMRVLKLCLPLIFVAAAFSQNSTDRAYLAIRNNDLVALRTLTKDHGLNEKDADGQTPLMLAAAFGSLDAMKLLLANGADVRAVSGDGVTALHWAAGDVRKVRLLLDGGAEADTFSLLG